MTRLTLTMAAAVAALMTTSALAQTQPAPDPMQPTTPGGTTPASDSATTPADDPTMQQPSGDPAAQPAQDSMSSQPMTTPSTPASAAPSGQPGMDGGQMQQPSGQPATGSMNQPGSMSQGGSMAQPSGGAMASGMTPADQNGFAPQVMAGMTEEQGIQGDGQLETRTTQNAMGGQHTVTASTPIPNPPENTRSSSRGRGGGR